MSISRRDRLADTAAAVTSTGTTSQRTSRWPRNHAPLMEPYGIPAGELAKVCGVDLSTARRWKRAGRIPGRYHQLIALARGHDLGALAPAWAGWTFHDAMLWTPENQPVTPGSIRAMPYQEDRISALKSQLHRLLETIGPQEPVTFTLQVEFNPHEHGMCPRVQVSRLEALSRD